MLNLLDNIFNTDSIEINKVNKKYLIILIIICLLSSGLFLIRKDYYYQNKIIIDDDRILLLVDKDKVNEIKKKKIVLIDDIKTNYSINKIINDGNICYIDINLEINIENISDKKYRILLGKETIFEYIIRVIKKVS